MKKLICLLLVIVIISSSTITAYADTTSGTLINPITVLIAAATIVTGAAFNSVADMKYFVSDYFYKQSSQIKEEWLNTSTLAKGASYAVISNNLYQSLKTYFNTSFVQGTNSVGSNSAYLTFSGGIPASPISKIDYPNQSIITNLFEGTTYTYLIGSKASMYTGMNNGASVIYAKQFICYRVTGSTWSLVTNQTNANYYAPAVTVSNIPQSSTQIYDSNTFTNIAYPANVPLQQYNVNLDSIAFNPNYDWNNISTGNKAVPYPGNSISADGTLPDTLANDYLSNDLINLTSQDIINAEYPIDIPIDVQLDQILTGVTGIGNISVDIKTGIEALEGKIDGISTTLDGIDSKVTGLNDTMTDSFATVNEKLDNLSNPFANEPELDIGNLQDAFTSKFQVDKFVNAYDALMNMNTAQGVAPKFEIDLNQLANTTSHITNKSNIFGQNGKVIYFDMADWEKHYFMGMSIIQLIRTMIAAGFIFTTLGYCYHKFIPNKVIGGSD